MTVSIYQPQYFPRLHYFNRLLSADTFVFLESAQYVKTLVHETITGHTRHKSYQSNTPIKTSNGVYHLTVFTKHEGLLPINRTNIDYLHKWHSNHLANLKANYSRAPLFQTHFADLRILLTTPYRSLADLNIKTTLWGIAVILGFTIPIQQLTIETINQALKKRNVKLQRIVSDKDLGVQRPMGLQKGTEWTTSICKALHATAYLHGETAQTGYMDLSYYKKQGIALVVQDWKCPEYTQQYTKQGFIPNLSIVDLLLNEDQVTVQKTLGIV